MTSTVDDLEHLRVVQSAKSEKKEHLLGIECSDKKDYYECKKKKNGLRALSTPHCATNVLLLLVLSFMANGLLLMSVMRRDGSLPTYRAGTVLRSLNTENISKATNRCDSTTTYEAKAEGDALGPPKGMLYGHIHIAKTAGSELNGELANHFERVCGNKGNSYDALQLNKRFSEYYNEHADGVPSDIVNLQFGKKKGRANVPREVLREIGFEDCDYISMEAPYWFWLEFKDWNLQLHVPCRDPLEHLMSQCNHKRITFDCGAQVLQEEVSRCVFGQQGFSPELKKQSNISLKCFNSVPPDSYIHYMSSKLQRRKVESKYFHRSTNKPRNREKECIWKDPEVASAVEKILLEEYRYYKFCRQCMGSEDEIAPAKTTIK